MTETKPSITVIRNCEWLVAWDAVSASHVYENDGDFAFTGNRIVHVGKSYDGPFDVEIDGRRRMFMPGFFNLHSNTGHETGWKGMQ